MSLYSIPTSVYRGYYIGPDLSGLVWTGAVGGTPWFEGATEAEVRNKINEALDEEARLSNES